MSEWMDAKCHAPPRDGTWLIAMWPDFGGFEFTSFYEGRWIDGDGDAYDEPFSSRWGMWCLAPKWMRPPCEQRDAAVAKKEFWDGVMAENDARAAERGKA